jgi:hypothetical protein
MGMKEASVYSSLCQNAVTAPWYVGIFARNELAAAPLLRKHQFIILNTGKRQADGSGGEHWITLYRESDTSPVLYADSLSLQPPFREIFMYLFKHGDKYFFNKQPLQSIFSERCGEFSCWIAHELCRGRTLVNIRSDFCHSDLSFNDKIVVCKYRKAFGYVRLSRNDGCELTSAPLCTLNPSS